TMPIVPSPAGQSTSPPGDRTLGMRLCGTKKVNPQPSLRILVQWTPVVEHILVSYSDKPFLFEHPQIGCTFAVCGRIVGLQVLGEAIFDFVSAVNRGTVPQQDDCGRLAERS